MTILQTVKLNIWFLLIRFNNSRNSTMLLERYVFRM